MTIFILSPKEKKKKNILILISNKKIFNEARKMEFMVSLDVKIGLRLFNSLVINEPLNPHNAYQLKRTQVI